MIKCVQQFFMATFLAIILSPQAHAVDAVQRLFNAKDGLVNYTIKDIVFDDYGYVWLGTEQGLFRVSNTVVRRVDQPDSTNALDDENINLLVKVDSHHILVGSGTFLYLYDIQKNQFSDVIVNKDLISRDDSFGSYTRLRNGNLLLLSEFGSVFEFNVNSLLLSHVTAYELDEMLAWNSVVELESGNLIFAATHNIEVRNKQGQLVNKIDWYLKNERIRGLFVDSDEQTWILSNKGLFELEPLSGDINAVTELPYSIHSMTEDARGFLWLNTTQGLFSWNKQLAQVSSYKDALKNSVDIDYIDDVAIDSNGLVWLGGSGEGLALLAIQPDFLLDSFSASSEYKLNDDMVWSVLAQSEKLWLGGNGSLIVVDKSTLTSKQIIPSAFEANDSIYGITDLDDDHVILSTTNGLFVYNKHNDAEVDFKSFARLSNALRSELLTSAYADPLHPGRIWWGTFNQVYYWEPGLADVQTISLSEHSESSRSVKINSFYRESDNRLWLGGEGFFGYLDNNNSVTSLTDILLANFDHPAVNNISKADHSTLWLGTYQEGLIAFNTQSHTTAAMSELWNVDCRTIYFIEQTETFNLVGCTSSIIRQNKHSGSIEVFSTSDGFTANEFNESASFYDQNAGLYIGSPNGAMLIDVDKLERRNTNDEISLESIAIFYEDSTEYHFIPETFEVVRPDAKLISFQITTFDYIDDSPISLKYRLVHENNPFNTNYIYLEGQTQINVADLDAGQYTLELLHKKHGVWAVNPFQFHFKVEQFWWLSQWFRAVVLFAILFMAFTSVWFRQKQVKRVVGINRALRESEDKLRQSLRGSDSDLWEWESATNKIHFENKSGILGERRQFSYPIKSLPIFEIDKDNVHEQWRALFKGEKDSIDIEFRYHRAEDIIGWIRIRGRVVSRDSITGKLDRIAGIYTEVSEQRELQNEIDLFAKAFENTSEGMIILDGDKRVKLLNNAAVSIFETQHDLLISQDFESLQFTANASSNLDNLLLKDRSWNGELTFKRASSEYFPVWANISKMSDVRGMLQHYVVVFSDITERKQNESNLKNLANNDGLTGLANRCGFNRHLELIIEQAANSDEKLALLFLDLDRFKHVNDSYGHSMGDALLVEAAKRLQDTVGSEHLVCRFGGDEFVILLRNASNIDLINVMAEDILRKIEAPFSLFGRDFFVSTSIGISMWPEDTHDPETLIKNADLAMYHAKDVGRGNFQYYSAERNAEAQYHLRIEADLRKAIEDNEFELYYQPQVDILQGDKFIGMEALIRWNHVKDGFIRPDIFIKVAESCGLIIDIDRWVLRQACIDGARWHELYDQPFQLSVNVSAVQFRQVDFIENLKATIEDTGMPAKFLAIEITEGVLMKELKIASSHLKQLKQLGIEVAIDDFGTGYSSLAYLRNFEVNTLKIDRSFLIDIASNEADQAIVSSIIELARNLKLHVVAEGIESYDQMEQVFSRGCYIIQGYYFAKPMPKAKLDKFIGIGKDDKTIN